MKKSQKTTRLSFAAPLIILMVGVLVISLIVQVLFVSSSISDDIIETQNDSLMTITRSIAESIELELVADEHILMGYGKALSMAIGASRANAAWTGVDGVSSATVAVDGDLSSLTDLNGGLNDGYAEVIESIEISNSFFDTIFIAGMDGIITASNSSNVIGADISERDYFKAIVEEGQDAYTTKHAIVSKATGELTIVHAARLYQDDSNFGMLGVSLNLTRFGDEIVLNKRIGETGYPYILDRDGMVLVHPSADLVGRSAMEVDDFFQQVVDSTEEIQAISYELSGSPKQGVFVRLEEQGWIVCVAINDDEAFAMLGSLRLILIVSSIIMLIIISFTLFTYVRIRLIKKVNDIEALISKAADGDLTERGAETGRDEISGMSRNFNTLLDSFSGFFLQLSGSLYELEEVGTDLSSNMEETASAVYEIRTNVENSLNQISMQEDSVASTVSTVEQITQNIQSLDKNIAIQNESIQQGSSAVEQMISQIKAVSASTEEAERVMVVLEDSSNTGRENLHGVSSLVKSIDDKSRELEQANALISGIAAQTNLLAMNAAIEAAHAGDAGRGFAVVADEIRKLAEQSTAQSAQVKATIADINQSIQEVVDSSETTTHSFEDIVQNMGRMSRITAEIKSSMEEQVSGSNEILKALDEMQQVGREVSSGSQEMTDGNKVILSSVGKLSQISNEVAQAINEIDNGMDEINRAVTDISGLTQKNKGSIDAVRAEASKYNYESRDEEG